MTDVPEETSKDERPWEELELIAESGDGARMAIFLDGLGPGEVARAMGHLGIDEQAHVLEILTAEEAADVMDDLPFAQATEAIEHLQPEAAAAILHEMRSDDRADIIGELDDDDANAILARLAPDEAEEIRELAAYDADTAGGLMFVEYLSYRDDTRGGELINDLRLNAELYKDYDVQYVYVIDAKERLLGVLPMRSLLLAPIEQSLSEIMIPGPVTLNVKDELEDIHDTFEGRSFLALPVVDDEGCMLGVVRRYLVEEAYAERAESDHLKSQGIVGDELRSMPLLRRARRRLSWLSINILLNVAAASVIAFFEATLTAVIALAFFLPIISDMSGCSGNQAVAVSIRELTLGVVKPHEVVWVWLKEAGVGVINGLVLGLLIGVVALIWKGNAWLGIVVGGALAANTLLAVSIGGIIPLILKRFDLDPALASGPVLTTLTDICGFFFVLGFATVMLDKLVA